MATKKMQSQGGERTFKFSDPLFIIAMGILIILTALLIWSIAHTEISALYVYVRYAQVWLLNLLGAFFDLPVVSSIRGWVLGICAPESGVLLCTRDFSTVSWVQIMGSTIWFNALFIVLLAVWCLKMFIQVSNEHPTFRFRKKHSIRSFAQENAELYPHIPLFLSLDLTSKGLDDPVFGMSETTRQFAYKNGLLQGWQETPDGTFLPVLNRERATAVFWKQLGELWTKSGDLTIGETILFAMVVPRVAATDNKMSDEDFNQAIADSDELIAWCWRQFTPPKTDKRKKNDTKNDDYGWLKPDFDLRVPRKVIARYIKSPMVVDIIQHHAYKRTILYACYMQAGKLGVFPPTDVRWLRFYDKELWGLRSSMGRQVAFSTGGSAVFSHYLYEKVAGHAIVEPQVDKAVTGIDEVLLGYRYTIKDKELYESYSA